MRLDNLKRWHWMLISLLVGALLGGIRVWAADEEQAEARTINSHLLLADLAEKDNGVPRLSRLVLYPPVAGVNGNYVLFAKKRRPISAHRDPKDRSKIIPAMVVLDDVKYVFQTSADLIPVRDLHQHVAAPTETPVEYLKKLQAKNPTWPLAFRYAWYEYTPTKMAIWMAGSFVGIGIIWPTLVNLIAFGAFRRPRDEEKTMDLSRYGHGTTATARPVAAIGLLSAEEEARLKAMEDSLAGFVTTEKDEETKSEEAAVVRKLTGAPLETVSAPVSDAAKDKKDFGGEFYPTVAHAPKKKGK